MDSYTKQKSSARPFVLAVAFLGTVFLGYKLFFQDTPVTAIRNAVVVLSGDSSVTGTVTFQQSSSGDPVQILGKIQGLSSDSLHGFHVHVSGDLSGGCLSAGAHFNPFGKTHGAPSASVRHVGDLGNIKTDKSGTADIDFSDRLISLNGVTSIIGRSVVVHAGTDDLGLGGNEESLKTGNAGGRVACGVIGLA
ncbi:hypothetical protein CVT25_012888 [Psilocybe cyanescens]|uniref:Superoxide dismutase [Cu-Zn] n=1 Tax=Psilocybe cyanescens TaxID=93625 RepID=A0A409XLJ3_PSICY|nr:hypothetical protein CVT25_012888 [Psilocybe cyanescens]